MVIFRVSTQFFREKFQLKWWNGKPQLDSILNEGRLIEACTTHYSIILNLLLSVIFNRFFSQLKWCKKSANPDIDSLPQIQLRALLSTTSNGMRICMPASRATRRSALLWLAGGWVPRDLSSKVYIPGSWNTTLDVLFFHVLNLGIYTHHVLGDQTLRGSDFSFIPALYKKITHPPNHAQQKFHKEMPLIACSGDTGGVLGKTTHLGKELKLRAIGHWDL